MQDTPQREAPAVPQTRLDRSQWYWPGPRRVFTDAELARAGRQPWLRGVDAFVWIGILLNLVPLHEMMSKRVWLITLLAAVAVTGGGLGVARWLWQRPTRTGYNVATIASSAAFVAVMLGVRHGLGVPRETLMAPLLAVGGIIVFATLGWWAVVMLRSQQIAGRLAELDEQARNLRLARRLATAQIQPHFLFNTLASLQHWVDTQDPRAGTTLRSFTQYLRATLPMFERESLSLAEELQIVRSYLEVMQARLGARLAWGLQADPRLDALQLPPGLLLTLVENAIGHGIEPALRGGRIDVRAQRVGPRVQLEVQDDGAGVTVPLQEGVGLTNTRERLRQLYGADAQLTLRATAPGCLARIDLPWEPSTT